MPSSKPAAAPSSPVKEPKFCRCRLCHEHFYGATIAQARAACARHARQLHPGWRVSACYCPD
jgi:hypothetical protein